MSIEVDWRRAGVVIGLVAAGILCDQATKAMARESLMGEAAKLYWDGFFVLTFTENRGAFLSLGAGLSEQLRYWGLKVGPMLLLAGILLHTLLAKGVSRLQAVAFGLIIGGGISNVYDRIAYNKVVDFMLMGIGGLKTGVFNFADVFIMAGLGIMLLGLFRRPVGQ